MRIPYAYHSYRDYNPASGRWDQNFLDRILRGDEHRPPTGFEFFESTHDEVIANGGVLILPVGSYKEHEDGHAVLREVWADLLAMPWGVVFATSDECDRFEWFKIDPWPEHIQLYVQLPRPDHSYPPGTRFFGEGSPVSAVEIQAGAAYTRDLDLMLVGQGGHERRDQCFDAVFETFADRPERAAILQTEGFTLGRDQETYLHGLTRTWVAPAPSGICSPSSFRAFEAFEAGAIPLLDDVSPKHDIPGYWRMIGLAEAAPTIVDWNDNLAGIIDGLLERRHFEAARVSSFWQQYKRRFVEVIHDDVARMSGEDRGFVEPEDQITVVVVTSAVPSNPSLDMIQETIASVRTDLPGAEVLICCDGLRKDQQDRRDNYEVFLQRLTQWCLSQWNITPFVYDEHLHQSGMTRKILNEVRTPYLLFMEHDCPLVNAIPWGEILFTMSESQLNSMRFMHETMILDGHEHLFFDRHDGPAPWQETLQWSQRPHLARTNWYRDLINDIFAEDARTMVEDVMHGVLQYGMPFTTRIQASEAWERWRTAVYAPEGNMKRSGHLDGRAGDSKGKMLIKYANERPDGAPPAGWTQP